MTVAYPELRFLVLHSLTEYNFITYYYHNNAYPYHPYRSDDVFNDFNICNATPNDILAKFVHLYILYMSAGR